MSKWNKVGRVLRLWLAVAVSASALAGNLVSLAQRLAGQCLFVMTYKSDVFVCGHKHGQLSRLGWNYRHTKVASSSVPPFFEMVAVHSVTVAGIWWNSCSVPAPPP